MAKATSGKVKKVQSPKKTLGTKKTIARVNTRRTIKTIREGIGKKSLSPGKAQKSPRKDSDAVEPKKRGRPAKTPQASSVETAKRGRPVKESVTSPVKESKGVERVIDIREIKKHAERILKDKQKKAPSVLRVSPRKKNTTMSTPEKRVVGRPKVIQTISDGPTVSLLSQNKIIQKNLPKKLRNVQKKLLKKQIANKLKTGQGSKKSNLLKKNDKLKNQKIIQKLTKILLKNKALNKRQLEELVKNKTDFKAIASLVSLLKAKKKSVSDVQKNEWNVSVQEEEEEDEELEEEEEVYEPVDDEDRDKDYVPPIEEQTLRKSSRKGTSPIVDSIPPQYFTPLPSNQASSNVQAYKTYGNKTNVVANTAQVKTPKPQVKASRTPTPLVYRRKPNRLHEGDVPMFPVDSVKKSLSRGSITPNRFYDESILPDDNPVESIDSISALLEQSTGRTPLTPKSTEANVGKCLSKYYCDLCNMSYKCKATGPIHVRIPEDEHLVRHNSTWLHKVQENMKSQSKDQGSATTDTPRGEQRDPVLISQIKQEMIRQLTSQIDLSGGMKGSPLFKANLSSSKYILDSELNLSLVMDSLNLILTNDIEDDEDAYDTLQMALGASDADMDRLKDLAGQTITAEYVYDNSNPNSNQGIFDPSESALLIEEYRHDMLDIDMETRAMGCPSPECDRTYFGLVGLQTHIKYWHRNESFLQKKTTYRFLPGPEPLKYVCFVCKEMFMRSAARDEHVASTHRANEASNNANKQKLVLAFQEILEATLRKCLANAERKKGKTQEGEAVEIAVVGESGEVEDGGEGFDEYDDVTLLGREFIRKLKASEDGLRAYDLLVKLINPLGTPENAAFIEHLIVKLHTILGKVVRSTLLPISNEIVISSRQQHNVYNSDSRERPFQCPVCEGRYLTSSTRNKHFSRAHPIEYEATVALPGGEEFLPPSRKGVLRAIDGGSQLSPAPSETSTIESVTPSVPLDKASVLNELKIRMNKKVADKLRGKIAPYSPVYPKRKPPAPVSDHGETDEEEMLTLEDEYLTDEVTQSRNTRSGTTGTNNLQQVIQSIQSSIKQSPAYKPPIQPFTKVSNNFKCLDCDRVFIKEDELYHHNRLEHSDKNLVFKLNDIKKKTDTTPGGTNSSQETSVTDLSGISPIKPVQIITAHNTSSTSTMLPAGETPGKQLAPLLTRKELQQSSARDVTEENPTKTTSDEQTTGEQASSETVTNVVKIGTRQLVLQRTSKGSAAVSSPRKIMMSPEGNIDKVLQRDGSCLIEFDQANPVSISSLDPQPTTSTVKKVPSQPGSPSTPLVGQRNPTAPAGVRPQISSPLIKTPLATKLVSRLKSQLIRSQGTPPVQTPPTQTPPTRDPDWLSSPDARAGSESSETPNEYKLKRGPRRRVIDDEEKQRALALIKQLDQMDMRKVKRSGVSGPSSGVSASRARKNTKDEESEEEYEDRYLEEEDSGMLLTNSQSWKRVAEVAEDWNTSEEEEDEQEVVSPRRTTRAVKRKS
ncbi:hypothetical protein M8J76_013233 [Diaphorina citri]|nr:hypothetical protein M8J76_013233 [Diaphorina citri]